MKFNRITQRHNTVTFVLMLMLCLTVMLPEPWAGVDAYVVYSGKNHQEKQSFLDALPKELSVKSYNADRLALADYSGKQKALTKFQRASVVVMLLDEPMKLLKGSKMSRDLIIVQSVMASVKSDARTLYVLSQDTDYSTLGEKIKTLNVTNKENLQKNELQGVDVILIDEQTLPVIEAASLVTATILSP